MKRLDIFKLFKVAPAESDSNPEHEKLRRDVKKPGWLSVTPTPDDIRSDEEVNEEGERPLTHDALGQLGEGIMDRTEGLGGGYSQDTTPEELEEMKRVEDKKRTQERVSEAFKTHPELRNSSAVQNLLKYIDLEKVFAVGPGGSGDTEVISDAKNRERQQEAHEKIMDRIGAETSEAEEKMEERKGKYARAKAGEPGGLGQAIGFLTETGLAGAQQQRGEGGQIPQGPVQGSQAGVGTGRSSAIARQKAQQPPPAQRQPQMPRTHKQPIGVKMEKDYEADKYEDEYEEYNENDRPKRKSKMKVDGKGVQNLLRVADERVQQARNQRGD